MIGFSKCHLSKSQHSFKLFLSLRISSNEKNKEIDRFTLGEEEEEEESRLKRYLSYQINKIKRLIPTTFLLLFLLPSLFEKKIFFFPFIHLKKKKREKRSMFFF